jgi:broad specificity phosphatase PhoE
MLQLYFLRHGQTVSSRENLFCGSGTDIPLTQDGEEMARSFARYYSDAPWTAIYHSPLERTRDTAEIINPSRAVPMYSRGELTEIGYGNWEGKSVEEVERHDHDEHLAWTADPAWYPPSGGESATSVARRVLSLIEEIQDACDDGKVLLISHKATIRIALCGLLGIDVGRFRYRLACPVGSLSSVDFGEHGPLVQRIGDRAHLSDYLKNLPGT